MQQKHLSISHKARYHTVGTPGPKTKYVWLTAHGYGMLSLYFGKNFEFLNPEEHYVVVAEGLNRFYLQGVTGRVGANWMTKEDRLTDIENYLTLLNSLYLHEMQPLVAQGAKVMVLGFSQGVATLSRWVNQSAPPLPVENIHKLVLWAGEYPADMDPGNLAPLRQIPVYVVVGNQDPYFEDEARRNGLKKRYAEAGIKPFEFTFEGGHTMHQHTLQQIMDHPGR